MKNRMLTLSFCGLLAGMLALFALLPDRAVSYTERRTLRQLPTLSWDGAFSGSFGAAFDRYVPDQFPGRETFRKAALLFRLGVLRQRDYNGAYTVDGQIAKLDGVLNEASVDRLSQNIETLADGMFEGGRVYCALIPDKGAFLAQKSGRPGYDFAQMEERLRAGLSKVRYIELAFLLDPSCYYDTDIHWRQERIRPVAARLCDVMGAALPQTDWRENAYTPFYGSYYGQAVGVRPDTLVYLTNEQTETAIVSHLDKAATAVYAPDALGKMDSYDVFLSGATSLATLTNTRPSETAKGRTLVLVRDSFGSSLAPLLLPAYERIVLADLRYMPAPLLETYVEAGEADVLFLYGAETANHSAMLRFG